jgi:long-chain acyl-CoA synthetase
MNLAELALRHARESADTVAIRMGTECLTYAELASESKRVADGLADLGVLRGDRVMMFSENCLEYLVVYLATARLGAVFSPVHASFQVNELSFVLANATPRALIAQGSLWSRLDRCDPALVPSVRIDIDGRRGDLVTYAELGQNSSSDISIATVSDDDPILICYTSGTTDRPHPVARSHAHEIWNARTYADVWDYRPGDVALVTLPLSWLWGLSSLSQALLSVGATIVLHAEFDAFQVLDEIERSQISLFTGTMSMFTALSSALNANSHDLSSLRRVYRGGEPINNEVVRNLEARLGLRLTDAYATTEVAPVIAVDPNRDTEAPPFTAGRLVPGAKVRLVDDNGEDVAVGEVGEAWLGGRGLMLGYWNEPALTKDRMTADGWFRSGDLLVENEDGFYFVVGRSSDVIIRDGAKIAPAEVESALAGISGVLDAAAVGVPDDEFGESIVAFLVLAPDCVVSVDDVYDHLSDRIARFKLPSNIYFVDTLPVRRNEKRDRASIRRHALEAVAQGSASFGSTTIVHGTGRARLRIVD